MYFKLGEKNRTGKVKNAGRRKCTKCFEKETATLTGARVNLVVLMNDECKQERFYYLLKPSNLFF